MKKILISLVIIAVAGAIGFGATKAYFTDTETSTGNTFSAGTIDIAVNGENPWTATNEYVFEDMKPSQVEYSNFTVQNVGTNPVNVYKRVDVRGTSGGIMSEPECLAQGGTWSGTACGGGQEVSNLDSVIQYDLSVKVKDANGTVRWEQVLYKLSMPYTLADLNGKDVMLGMIPKGWSMDVVESYHMDSSAGNEYQGDDITFDITVTGEQLKGTVVLEDKDTADWRVKGENTTQGVLTYGVKDDKFNYSFTAAGIVSDGNYTLVAWEDPTYQWTWGSFSGTTVLANVVVSGGVASVSGSLELGKDLLNSKVWLVPGNLGTPGQTGVTLPWSPASTLFETGLVDYYNSI